MNKFLLSISVIGLFIFYSAYKQNNGSMLATSTTPTSPPPDVNSPTPNPTSIPIAGSSSQSTVNPTNIPPTNIPPTSIPRGQYRDGSYNGDTVDVFYGNVQVQAIIRNGKIADVKFLQSPSDRQTSVYINSQAMPMLTSEAIQAQSANIDGVSGASATSQGFVTSLSSALTKAK